MSEGLNKVMLLGNLGADPELKVTQGGLAILKLRLATTESYLDKDQTRQERTEWHSVSMFGKRAEALSRFLKKGARLFVEGGLRTSSYEKNSEKRYRTEIVATNVILSGSKRDDADRGDAYEPPEPARAPGRSGGGRDERPGPPPAAKKQEAPAEPFGGDDDYFGGTDPDIPF